MVSCIGIVAQTSKSEQLLKLFRATREQVSNIFKVMLRLFMQVDSQNAL